MVHDVPNLIFYVLGYRISIRPSYTTNAVLNMLKILCVEILDEYVRSYITLLVMTVQNVLNVLYIEVLSEYITS